MRRKNRHSITACRFSHFAKVWFKSNLYRTKTWGLSPKLWRARRGGGYSRNSLQLMLLFITERLRSIWKMRSLAGLLSIMMVYGFFVDSLFLGLILLPHDLSLIILIDRIQRHKCPNLKQPKKKGTRNLYAACLASARWPSLTSEGHVNFKLSHLASLQVERTYYSSSSCHDGHGSLSSVRSALPLFKVVLFFS
jgi:hypothetical protein